jgi:hypothetical protein
MANRILNYFVFISGNISFALKSPVTINAVTAKILAEKEIQKKLTLPLHICFDVSSGYIYVPNVRDFDRATYSELLKVAKLEIIKEFGNNYKYMVIEGSPFSSLRLRSISHFKSLCEFVNKSFGELIDLPVLEVNLDRMPLLIKNLPLVYKEHKNFLGSYIGKSFCNSISFIDEIDNNGLIRKDPIHLITQNSPFILINVSPSTNPDASEKEWVVLNGYRDFLEEERPDVLKNGLERFADLYAIKRNLYLGWSFEEVSAYLMDQIKDFGQLLKTLMLLNNVSEELKKEGYPDPSSIPYCLSFKIDPSDFPLILDFLKDEKLLNSQPDYFKIISYNCKTNYIIIQSSAYIAPILCERILKAKSKPLIVKYDVSLNQIVVKTDASSYNENACFSGGQQLTKIRLLYSKLLDLNDLQFIVEPSLIGVKGANPSVFIRRKISDYYYASDFIKSMCDREGVDFNDIEVIIGPVERIMGKGTQGGFMGKIAFLKANLPSPYKIAENLMVSPPVIFINSVTSPSYAEQTETLIHEYRHYIYEIQNPFYENKYSKIDKNTVEYWKVYLSDSNEKEAHKAGIQFDLKAGKSVDEIIRDKVGGEVTDKNYHVAVIFSNLVKEGERDETDIIRTS